MKIKNNKTDKVIKDIADYVNKYKITSKLAIKLLDTVSWILLDAD